MMEKIYNILLCALFLIPLFSLLVFDHVNRYRERHSKIWLSSDLFIQNGCVYKINESGVDDAK